MTSDPRSSGEPRSRCPINLTLELLGDRWSLIILRDIMFGGRRHFRELLTQSEEGISSNILADRLKMLLDQGLVTKADDPTHKQKAVYSLTEKSITLLPVLAQMAAWGRRHMPVTSDMAIRAQLMEEGGPELWAQFMDELRAEHLGVSNPANGGQPSVRETLYDAYLDAMAKRNTGETDA